MSLPGLVILLVILITLERFGLWFTRRSWLPWRRHRTGMPVSVTALDVFGAVLEPSRHNELEQRYIKATIREDDEEGAPPPRSTSVAV
ncbi:MAG TPA: DUF6191 domain-containing protein [Pseudonocardiaceae bacterium]|nr:DUF6191 domain-containing protein [Pseudonocardiaceae bacterium]